MVKNKDGGKGEIIIGIPDRSILEFLGFFWNSDSSTRRYPTGLGTIPIGIRSENPLEFHWKMFQNSEFITSHLKNF
jgi:hypothetical protein